MRKYSALIYLMLGAALFSCEDYENPVEGIEETGLFVEFSAGTKAEQVVAEGESITLTVLSPISFEEELTATLAFEGTAVYGVDFTVESEGLVSVTEEGAVVTIPFIPTNDSEVVPDQVDVTINFLTDGVTDPDKTLVVSLEGATGPDGIVLEGGRGPIRNQTAITIEDTPLVLFFSPGSVLSLENSVDTTNFLLSLNFPVPQDLTINLGTSGDLIVGENVELLGFNNVLTIPAGETEVAFGVRNIDDILRREGTDSLNVFIDSFTFSGDGLSLEVETDSVNFFLEDEPKLISVNVEGDTLVLTDATQRGYKKFTVMLENPSSEVVTLEYTITAINGLPVVDYVDVTEGEIEFLPGETSSEIVIRVRENAFTKAEDVILAVELDETALTTADEEVAVDEENKAFVIMVVNE